MNASKRYDAKERIYPLLEQFCTQKSVKIDLEKLAKLNNLELSLLDIAWLQSISEMNYPSFSKVWWDSQVLLDQVTVITTYLFHISKKEIGEDPNDYSFKEAQTYLLNTIVSLSRAIELFDSIKLENRFDDEKIEGNSLLKGIKKLERARLSEINLKTELLRNQMEYCKNNPVTLVPEQLPEKIWLKELAYYLAVSQKIHKDYVDIDYDDLKIIDCASSIHFMLRKKIREILGVVDVFSALKSAYIENSKRAGILDIAAFAVKKNDDFFDKWSLLVTKELALRILKQLPVFKFLFENNVENYESKTASSGAQSTDPNRPSNNCNYETKELYLDLEQLLKEQPKLDLKTKAIWSALLTKQSDIRYKIKTTKPHESKPRSIRMVFASGYSPDYHSAQAHIQTVIKWFKSKFK
ncbi:TPA: hypothetical protein RJX64_002697 [Legionella pneumophila]|nr:hypothetical protein [Legionella pneumophila]